MKKITTLLAAALCVFAFSTQAQYIVSSNINAGVNPGNLNNDNEYPVGGGLPAGWATLFTGSVNTSTTPSWTANQTIPFSFQFDSTAVTSYKVSTNGVVTFDVASTVNPTSTNANLPSTSIPDNSVVIWGLFAGGTGDYIISKTFGTAPNRQHWIMFNSYSTLGAGWAYWSVVLEETSNNIYVVDQRTNTGPNTLTVGVQIDTATAFVVPGSPNITSNTTNGPTPADNSYYQFTPGTPPSLDAEIASINVASKVLVNTNTTISADIRNLGTTTLTSVEFHYRINNGAIQSDTIALNLAYAAQATINHTIQWNPSSTSASNTIEAWLEAPNNGVDQVPSNDTLNLEVAVGNGNTVAKTALFEQFTTAVCQFCPDGAWVAGQMESNYANVATVSIHSCFSTDQMTNQEAVDLCATLGVNAAPTGMVDRKLFPSESDVAFGRGAGYPNWTASTWASRSLSQANAGSPVDVVVGGIYDPVTRNITVNVTASFTDFTEPGGDLGISLMIVEDSVIGSGTGYDQINAYNTSTGHPFAGRGNPITNYPHRRVMRDILPSTFGDVAAIPANYALNTPYNRQFNFTLNNAWDASHVTLIGIVSKDGGPEIGQYEIYNIDREKLSIATAIDENKSLDKTLNIYPNPTNLPFTNVEFYMENSAFVQARITDITGKVVSIEDFGTLTQGNQRIQLNTQDLENGFYFVNLKVGEYEVSRKISILK